MFVWQIFRHPWLYSRLVLFGPAALALPGSGQGKNWDNLYCLLGPLKFLAKSHRVTSGWLSLHEGDIFMSVKGTVINKSRVYWYMEGILLSEDN